MLSDEHRSWVRHALETSRGIDYVPNHEPGFVAARTDTGLATEDPGAESQIGYIELGTEIHYRLDQIERRPHRSLGVVLPRLLHSPEGGDRIARVLVYVASIAFDDLLGLFEIPQQHRSDVLGVS